MIKFTMQIRELKPSVVLTDFQFEDHGDSTPLEVKTAKIYSEAIRLAMLMHAAKEQSGELIEGKDIADAVSAAVQRVYREDNDPTL